VQDAHDVDFPYCKGPREINRPEMIYVLCCLLLEELAVLALGDDLHGVILSCTLIETMHEGFADDRMP
jgi:hypothetical protein